MKQVLDPEKEDIQGLVVSSYQKLKFATYLLFEINDAQLVRQWIQKWLPSVTASKEPDGRGVHLNLAFTAEGLRRLGHEAKVALFSRAFQEGMVQEHRQRVLGDTESLPEWYWGKEQPHLLALVYAESQDKLDQQVADLQQGDTGLHPIAALPTAERSNEGEPFGFADGISQPVVAGYEKAALAQFRRTGTVDLIPAGEVVLGYTNGHGTITEEQNPFGKNGMYLVFRQLQQHVETFHDYFLEAAGGDKRLASYLEAKAVGRWQSGAALVLSPESDNPALHNADDFSYAKDDPNGLKCPLGAHIRRANPRDSLERTPAIGLERTSHRRLLRRGRSYKGAETGLHFICICSDIERQFEFVQQTWLNNPSFHGLHGEADPLTAPRRAPDGTYTIQCEPVRRRLTGLPRFVTTRGGAYFFLPGLKTLANL